MKAAIYKTAAGYDVITSHGRLYTLTKTAAGFATTFRGKVGEGFKVAGVRVKDIPDEVKRYFFKLQKL